MRATLHSDGFGGVADLYAGSSDEQEASVAMLSTAKKPNKACPQCMIALVDGGDDTE